MMTMKGHLHRIKNLVIIVCVLISYLVIAKSSIVQHYLENPQALQTIILSLGIMAPLVIITLQAFQTTISLVPSQITTIAAGFVFGPWLGLFYSLIGAFLGSAFVFQISRKYGAKIASSIFNKKEIVHFHHFFKQKKRTALFLARITPIFPNDLVSFSAGLTDIPFHQFNIISTLGFIVQMIILTYFGSALSAGTFSPLLAIMTVAVSLLFLITVFKHQIKNILIDDFHRIERKIESEWKKLEWKKLR